MAGHVETDESNLSIKGKGEEQLNNNNISSKRNREQIDDQVTRPGLGTIVINSIDQFRRGSQRYS